MAATDNAPELNIHIVLAPNGSGYTAHLAPIAHDSDGRNLMGPIAKTLTDASGEQRIGSDRNQIRREALDPETYGMEWRAAVGNLLAPAKPAIVPAKSPASDAAGEGNGG